MAPDAVETDAGQNQDDRQRAGVGFPRGPAPEGTQAAPEHERTFPGRLALRFLAHLAADAGNHPVFEIRVGLQVAVIFFEQVVHGLDLLVGRAGGGVVLQQGVELGALGGGQLAVDGGREQLVERVVGLRSWFHGRSSSRAGMRRRVPSPRPSKPRRAPSVTPMVCAMAR